MKKIFLLFLITTLFYACNSGNSRNEKEISDAERMRLERTDNDEMEERISELLSQMTVEEKIGQMMQINNSEYAQAESRGEYYGAPPDILISIDTTKLIDFLEKYKVGSFLNGVAVPAKQWYAYSRLLQETNLKHNRLGIPVIYGIDHMHGANYLEDATIFPHSINMAATFDVNFSFEEGRIVSLETAALGHHWVFCPVVDLGKNPLWGRFYETYGEDPFLSSQMGAQYVHGLQNNDEVAPFKQAATAKHFIGYSDPRNGWDRTPAEISDQSLQEFFIPPFQAVIDAGIKSVMISGGEINGIPVHASYKLLTTVLRDQMGFKGLVVSDWEDVIRLYRTHKVAKDMKEATYIALMAGVDMSMTPYETDFFEALKSLVEEEKISMDRLDLSVSRILRLKFDLGLFDNPYPSNDHFDRIRREENVNIALQAAQESIVLIKNENILPIDQGRKIVVTGKNANSKKALAGGWSQRWIPESDNLFPDYMPTVFDALKTEFGMEYVTLASTEDLDTKATRANLIVVAVGEDPYSETPGNITDQRLPQDQLDLIQQAVDTGKPVLLIMIAGRPRLITEQFSEVEGFIWAGLPGFEGATALARVMSGKENPSGKLPFTFPAQTNHWYPYNAKNMELFFNHSPSLNTIAGFGHGLSYTNFTYSDLEISTTEISGNLSLTATINVSNDGELAGKESVLWFIKDEVGKITRPIKALKHFQKELIEPGETMTFTFVIEPEKHLSYPDENGDMILEPGDFKILVGDLSADFTYQ